MIWKKFRPYILEIVLIAEIFFAIFASRFSSRGFINDVVVIFAMASGLEGSGELKRRDRWKIHRNFFLCIIILFTSSLILLITQAVRDVYIQIGFYSCFAVLAAIFPVAYYLSRNHTKSTSQPTGANVS